VLGHPALYGLEIVKAECYSTTGLFEIKYMCNCRSPLMCPDAGNFLLWDAIHPTKLLHRALADTEMNTMLHVFL
jgi:phospholipase/lecithinase/hemolysin